MPRRVTGRAPRSRRQRASGPPALGPTRAAWRRRSRRSRRAAPAGRAAPWPARGRAPCPTSRPRGRRAATGWVEVDRAAVTVGERGTGQRGDVGEPARRRARSGSQQRRLCIAASRATVRHRSRRAGPLLLGPADHRPLGDEGQDPVDAELGELLHDHSGRSPFTSANATVIGGTGSRDRDDRPSGSRRGAEPGRPPRAARRRTA